MASITEKIARQIVDELEAVIGTNINIMNEEGLIIASKDASRIGSFHEGALLVIQKGEPVPIYSDDSHRGARQGMNMPIFFEGQLLGVIGITGEPADVADTAKIIQKMTEVMVREAYISRELEMEARTTELFVQQWLHRQWTEPEAFRLRGRTLSIDVDASRLAVVIELGGTAEAEPERIRQERTRAVMKSIAEGIELSDNDILTLVQTSRFVLLKQADEAKLPAWNRQLRRLTEHLTQLRTPVCCGVGRLHNGLSGAVESFEEAEQALLFAKKKGMVVQQFAELGIEALLHKIPEELKQEITGRFTPLLEAKDARQLLETLRVFLEEEQSINEASEKLFIHKNTLQYRLKKMKRLTGYDPRVFREAVLYWLALTFWEEH